MRLYFLILLVCRATLSKNTPLFHSKESVHEDLSDIDLTQHVRVPDEQGLVTRLLHNYDPASRPVFNASHPVVVYFGIMFIQICDMDERNQILTTNVWLEQEWTDERLKWKNTSGYGHIEKLRIPCDRIWLPDLVLYNSADDFTQGYMQSKVMVKADGTVFWPPPAKLRSICQFDVTFFPFDDQICHLKFGSWTYSGLQLDLMNNSAQVGLSNYVESGEWELVNITVVRNVQYYPCCPEEPFPDVTFYIHMRRRILYYIVNIIIPCLWLSALGVLAFILPPNSGEKVTLGITVLLAYTVFSLLIAENIPATSETVPLIGIYLTMIMTLTSLSIILTVFILHLHYATTFLPRVSPRLYKVFAQRIAPWVNMTKEVERYEESIRLRRVSIGDSGRLMSTGSTTMTTMTQSEHRLLGEYNSLCYSFRMAKKKSVVEEHDPVCSNKVFSKPIKELNGLVDKLNQVLIRNSKSENFMEEKNEWKLIAMILDRMMFWFFTIMTILSSIVLLLIVPMLKHFDFLKPYKFKV